MSRCRQPGLIKKWRLEKCLDVPPWFWTSSSTISWKSWFNTGWIRLSCIPLKLVCCWPSYRSAHGGLKHQASHEGANSVKTNHLWSLPGSSLETHQAIHVSQFYARIIQLRQRRKPVRQFTSVQLFAACWTVMHAAGWRPDTDIVPARQDSGDSKAEDHVLECK